MTHLANYLLAAALAAAAPPPASTSDSPPSGDQLVAQVAERLLGHQTFRAAMRQRIEMFGQNMTGAGVYLHKSSPRGLLLRLEWKLPLGPETAATIVQISDARFLWIRRDLPSGTLLSRVDLHQLQQRLQQSGREGLADGGLNTLPIGGLARLLQDLDANFDFGPPRAAALAEMPVWNLEGVWNTSSLRKFAGDSAAPSAADVPGLVATLPPHLPTRVRLVIGQQDLIPYRIEYLRDDPKAAETNTGPRQLAAIEILEPVVDQPLDDQLFVYQPGQQEVADHTELYLRSLSPDGT